MRTYLTTYCLSFLLALGFTPVVIAAAHRFGLIDIPNARSAHKKPVARLGGVAIYISSMLLMVAVLILDNGVGEKFRGVLPQIIAILFGSTVMFIIGLADDCFNFRARYKLFAQIAAAVLVCSFGVRIEQMTVRGLFTIDFGIYSWPLTIFWIVGVTNAVNIIDGLDGLAAGISAIACGVIAVLSIVYGNVIMAVLMLALLGSLTGFLFYNFNPAKIFMGDCGSLFLGFILASSSVICAVKSHALVGLALPVLVLGIPIFDTLFSMLRRFLERRSMFAADRSHFHHRLLDMGLNQRHTVIVAYCVTLLVALMGMLLIATRSLASVLVFACTLLMLVMVFRIVGSVRLRETIAALKSKHAHTSQAREDIRNFEDVQLSFRNVEAFQQWWQTCILAADKLDIMEIKLPLKNRDGREKILKWSKNFPQDCHCIHMNIPIADRRKDSNLKMQISVYKDGSLESAGRRAALFTRLIGEHNIAALPNEETNTKDEIAT